MRIAVTGKMCSGKLLYVIIYVKLNLDFKYFHLVKKEKMIVMCVWMSRE